MTVSRTPGDSLEAERIYCVYERARGPRRVGTRGRHNAQALTIDGHPATAFIVKPIRGTPVASGMQLNPDVETALISLYRFGILSRLRMDAGRVSQPFDVMAAMFTAR